MERKHYIDNIRWMTVLLVIVYHVIYMFNNSGVISNFGVQGIPQLDVIISFVYPWFMALLFVVAGVSAKHSLQKRSGKEFAKSRAKSLLVPSIAGIFLLGWIAGRITNYYTDMFMGSGDVIPGFIKYLIYCLCGIGPLWFAQELFLASMVLLLIRKIDKNKKLEAWGKKTNELALILLVIPFWLSSYLLVTPLIEVYRNGFYVFCFLLGYYVFSNEEVLEKIRSLRFALLGAGVICGILFSWKHYGENYSSTEVLTHPFTNVYAWIMILAIFANAKEYLNFSNTFTKYMTKINFTAYALHYPLLCVVAFTTLNYIKLPISVCYVVNLIVTLLLLPVLHEVISRIPVLRFLLLGISKEKKKVS